MNNSLKDVSTLTMVRRNPCLESVRDKNLYEQRHETGDIKFIIGTHEIHAHRCLLAALSPKYKAQFYGAMAESGVVTVHGVSPAAFDEYLRFFYMEEVKLTIENIEDVLILVQQSLVDELLIECTNFLLDAIGKDKLLWSYRLSLLYALEPLRKFCLKHFGTNTTSMFKMKEFSTCDHEMLYHLSSLNTFNRTEYELFKGCISWARAKCEYDGIDGSRMANLRTTLGNALINIQFNSMTARQFALISKKYAGLLTTHESAEIKQAILSNNNERYSKSELANKSLKCKIIVDQQPARRHAHNRQDCIGFSCDKAILLNGFILCNKNIDTVSVEINIDGKPRKCEKTMRSSNSKTVIEFLKPFKLKAKHSCRLIVKMTKKSSIGWIGYNVVSCTTRNDVSFKFTRDNRDGIYSITHLMFAVAKEVTGNVTAEE